MEIKEGTLVLVLGYSLMSSEDDYRKHLGIVERGSSELLHFEVRLQNGKCNPNMKYLIPLAQTDGTIKDPVEAFRKHLYEAITTLVREIDLLKASVRHLH